MRSKIISAKGDKATQANDDILFAWKQAIKVAWRR